jgi:rSAM/selenodomain-associated transferase 2
VKISVIIPALNEAEGILSSIFSVKQQQGEFEIVIVDGGSHDATVEIVRPHGKVVISERGRAVQMNSGARHSCGDVLLFLHADSQLHPEALPALEKAMNDPRTIAGTFMLRFDSSKFLLGLIAFFTRFSFRYFHYGDQGIFVRRSTFEQAGGFKEMPIMEDVDFLRRLWKMGRVTLIKKPVTTSCRRFLRHGIVHQQLLNIFLVISYLLGGNPESLLRWYERPE